MRYVQPPREMFAPCPKQGSLQAFRYESRGMTKTALVYLPYGYEDTDQPYPVLYLMHGGGGDENEFFGGIEGKTALKSLLDNAFATGYARPCIVVTPTYMVEGVTGARRQIGEAMQLTHRFPEELKSDLIPAVARRFRAADDRRLRAFGGFSMGGETTWSVMAQALNEIYCFLPLSGDYWAVGLKGGKDFPVETADALIQSIEASGVAPGDYLALPCTGDRDIAYEALDPMVRELAKRAPWFTFGDTPAQGNLCYLLKPGGWHTYDDVYEYLYLTLPHIFPS